MRLKKLILQGFKSFADRTEFVFDAPITGIVGPNGCGKSNVVDGFKWVLGEQSAKSLRGDAMLDVIFNGSASRKPMGMAEVTLVFDNPRRENGTRLLNLDTDEVSVGRRLYRDGTSEYTLNNQPARLKDIRELFLDTGVGVDAYSVIEQGRVAAMLEANPAERRLIFEEAAGISKFKQRKKEAQRKLEKVDQNLLRVKDIVEEVERRLRSVKVQAGRARVYQEHAARLAELRLQYVLHDYHTQHSLARRLQAQREDAQFRLDDAAADLSRRQQELTEKRTQLQALTEQRQHSEYELVQARARITNAQQRQQYARRQLQQISEQISSFEQDRLAAQERLSQVEAALVEQTMQLQRLNEELTEQRARIEQRQRAFHDGQLMLNESNAQVERDKAAILDLMRKIAQTSSRLGAIEIERRNIAAQEQRLVERRRQVATQVEELESQRIEAQSRLDEVLATLADQQQQLDQHRTDAQALGRHIAQLSEQLGSAKEHRSGLLSRQKLLQDLENRREGVSEGVKSVLRQRDSKYPFIRGLVADVLRVDVEHAHVIEAALDGRDQWLITDSQTDALAAAEQLAELEGRVNILCTDCLPNSTLGIAAVPTNHDWNRYGIGIRFAADLVRVEPEYRTLADHLLGRTVVVDTLADAHILHQQGPAGFRYVTRLGQVLEADGTLRAGPLTAAMGLLSRRSELESIAQQIVESDRRIEQLAAQLTEGNAEARAIEERINALRNAVYQSNTAKVELTSAIAQNADRQSSLRREQPLLDSELQTLLDQTSKLAVEEQQLNERRIQLEDEQSAREQRVQELSERLVELTERLKQLGEELTIARVALGQAQEKQLAAQQQVQRHSASKSELNQQIERIAASARALAERQGGVEHELEQAIDEERTVSEHERGLLAAVEALAGQIADLSRIVQELSALVEQARTAHSDIEAELHQLQVQESEVRVRLETLVQRTLEELQLDLPAKYNSLFEGQNAPGYEPGDVDFDAVAAEIKELRDKIQRLGNVNLDAIGEMDELEQRQQFLSTQFKDLTESKRQLEELINTINAESSLRFQQTFEAVREHFQGMFRKLFGGGKADIYLETELEDQAQQPPTLGPDGATVLPIMKRVDVLDAGIEIIARPPGKQPATISQLSGGEKTMTCIALLMSIFKSKPSPFCILDEVDAALDEANNQRFNQIVQEFLDRSQFIIITHSKCTMQIADMLYGVTMQEQGVSKRVAVKFDQVDAQGRISVDARQAEHAAA